MKAPSTFSNGRRRGVSMFAGVGLSKEESARKEAEIFDALARGESPVVLAAINGGSVPTIYAIDRREAKRRGVAPNLGSKGFPTSDTGGVVPADADGQAEHTARGGE